MFIFKTTVFVIVILLILEFYFNYFRKSNDKKVDEEPIENKEQVENFENKGNDNLEEVFGEKEDEEIIQFNNPNPWCKVSINMNDYTKYFIKINNFDEEIFLEWKKLIDSLDYDVDSKELILETREEYEALALVNLIISNMNKDIGIEEIMENRLITISIQKAKSHKLVCNKLKELIMENNKPIDQRNINNTISYNQDINEDNSIYENVEIKLDHPVNQNPVDNVQSQEKVYSNSQNNSFPIESFEPIPYGGSEFALI